MFETNHKDDQIDKINAEIRITSIRHFSEIAAEMSFLRKALLDSDETMISM
jgi:hypothetical protein